MEKRNTYKTHKKSKQCSKVLQLMDKDFTYKESLKFVLETDKTITKNELEKELNIYI